VTRQTRRQFLLTLGSASLGLLATACGSQAAPAPGASTSVPASAASASAKPAGASAPASPAASSASGSAQAKAGLAEVKITDIQITSAAGAYIAAEKGYFRDEGIQPTFVTMGSQDQIPALLSGTGDVAGTAIAASLYNALARGVSITMVADHGANLKNASAGGVAIRKDLVDSGKYKGPADMKGWRVTQGLPESTAEIALDKFLHQGGLSLSDIDYQHLGFPETVTAFANKGIDAAYFQEPFTTIALNQGLIVRGPIGYDIYPNQQIACVAFGQKLSGNKDLSLRYVRAYLRGVRDYVKGLIEKDQAMFDQVVPILIQHTTVKQQELFQKAIPSGLRPDATPNVQSLKDDLAYMIDKGFVKQQFDLSKYIDLSFIEQANKDLGPYK
jgi:NitT/TauT family transport system substrate-binding protein